MQSVEKWCNRQGFPGAKFLFFDVSKAMGLAFWVVGVVLEMRCWMSEKLGRNHVKNRIESLAVWCLDVRLCYIFAKEARARRQKRAVFSLTKIRLCLLSHRINEDVPRRNILGFACLRELSFDLAGVLSLEWESFHSLMRRFESFVTLGRRTGFIGYLERRILVWGWVK